MMQRTGQTSVHVAPARINLIGEHTDYTGGLVLPLAIPFCTRAVIEPNAQGVYRFISTRFSEQQEMSIADRSPRSGLWSDYPVGVLRQLQAEGIEIPPFTLTVDSDVPLGAGLSSSASIEVATALALLMYSGSDLTVKELALLCQRAENEYVQSPCGIMDQFVVAAAEEDRALMLHTRDLAYELLPLDRGELAGCVLMVANSGVRHSIASGDYGLRRRELEAGQNVLRGRFPSLRDLGDATLQQLALCADEMSPESFRRCRHVITENARVLEARGAMLAGDASSLGGVMTRAHASERDDFECSVEEIDFLVETALRLPGCHGARLTGGGFGGCTVNLVDADHAEAFGRALAQAYRDRFDMPADVYTCRAVDGAVARATRIARS